MTFSEYMTIFDYQLIILTVQSLALILLYLVGFHFYLNRKSDLSSYERGFNDGQIHKVENLRELLK